MKMEEFTIKRDFGPDIVFQGELLVRSERACRQPSAFGRWHDITVYRRSDGMWVVRIDFNTLCLHERPRTEVEIVDRPDDVEMVLASHEATEHLNHRWVRPRHENDKRRFLKTLVTNYDSLSQRRHDRDGTLCRGVSRAAAHCPPSGVSRRLARPVGDGRHSSVEKAVR